MSHLMELMPHLKYDENSSKTNSVSLSNRIKNQNKNFNSMRYRSWQNTEENLIKDYKDFKNELLPVFRYVSQDVLDSDESKAIFIVVEALAGQPFMYSGAVQIDVLDKKTKENLFKFNKKVLDVINENTKILSPKKKIEFDNLILKKSLSENAEAKLPSVKSKRAVL